METLPFAAKIPQNSSWGFGGIKISQGNTVSPSFRETPSTSSSEPSRNCTPDTKYDEYMPAVLLNSLKKDKKPFTYTPGRVDLSEVLNAKLQKRLDKKKVRTPKPITDDAKQVLVMPTYNSPLNMYSMENAIEALEIQAELTVKDKTPIIENGSMTLPRNYKYEAKDFEPKNVTQSKAFRVLQIITDTEEEENSENPKVDMSQGKEQRFSGLRDNSVIPSKYFQTLQKITHTDECDTTLKSKGKKTNMISHEDEMRFSGVRDSSIIPSKLFHNLQKITDTEPRNNVNQTYKSFSQPKLSKHETFVVPKFQVHNCNGIEDHHNVNPYLKRPAAFLPAKSQVMTVPKYYNVKDKRNAANMIVRSFEGTDF